MYKSKDITIVNKIIGEDRREYCVATYIGKVSFVERISTTETNHGMDVKKVVSIRITLNDIKNCKKKYIDRDEIISYHDFFKEYWTIRNGDYILIGDFENEDITSEILKKAYVVTDFANNLLRGNVMVKHIRIGAS